LPVEYALSLEDNWGISLKGMTSFFIIMVGDFAHFYFAKKQK
jgi:hypothetical protein